MFYLIQYLILRKILELSPEKFNDALKNNTGIILDVRTSKSLVQV